MQPQLRIMNNSLHQSLRGPASPSAVPATSSIDAPLTTLKERQQEVDLGTTIAAIIYDGGVLLAADTRTSAGQYIADPLKRKFKRITSCIYVLTSGSAADSELICDYTRKYITHVGLEMEIEHIPVKTVAKIVTLLNYSNRNILQSGLIVAGVDDEGPHIYQVMLGGACIELPWTITGSGSTYIWGYCDKYFRPNMPLDECKKVVHTSHSMAMRRDGSSGGVVRFVEIDAKSFQARESWALMKELEEEW